MLGQKIKALDKVFSEYIRLRDIGKGCITCGAVYPWKEMDCGHFVPRASMSTRWDEKNCASQCVQCNRFSAGKADIFGRRIDIRHGSGTAASLSKRKHEIMKFSEFQLNDKIKEFRSKINDLKRI